MEEKAERESIIERIKKLMNLSMNKGATEAEAVQAALKAQKLIADYDVGQDELHEGESREIEEMPSGIVTKNNFAKILAPIVARNFRCRCYSNTTYANYHSGRRRSLGCEAYFYGYRSDAEAAKITYQMLYKVGNRLANRAVREAREEFGTAAGVYNSFASGFLAGVEDELSIQCKALMLVIPKEVDESYVEFSRDFGHIDASLRNVGWGYYDEGKQAARDAVRSRRMGEGDGNRVLSPAEMRAAAAREAASLNSGERGEGRHR